MSFLEKLRTGAENGGHHAAVQTAPESANRRASNGLKDFLWLLGDVQKGHLLDLGPVWQHTVSFFTERGFRVYTEDVLRAWKDFLAEEEARLRNAKVGAPAPESNGANLADRFLGDNLTQASGTFHAILAWDVFDYVDAGLMPRLANRLHDLLRPNGVLLAAFHASKPEEFHRYRVIDRQTIELLPSPPLFAAQRVFQNREILNLFGHFRSSKTFVGRDQLREALFSR